MFEFIYMVSHRSEVAMELQAFCTRELLRYIPGRILFPRPSTTLPEGR